MLKKIKAVLAAVVIATSLSAPVMMPAIAHADVAGSKSDACAGIGLTGAKCGGDSDTQVYKLLGTIVNILSIIVGVAAVIMIIVSGFKYITSGGDANNVSGAKNTLIYAIVGLIIVALAQVIVRFVLTTAQS